MSEEQTPGTPSLGIPQDVEEPAGLSLGAKKLFRALRELNQHKDPDRMMRDLEDRDAQVSSPPSKR
jgi:hypothetical protein